MSTGLGVWVWRGVFGMARPVFFGSPEPEKVKLSRLKVVRLDLGCHSWTGRVAKMNLEIR